MTHVGEVGQVLGHKLDRSGRLENLDEWSEEVARALAALDGLELSEQHWEIINLMREYYKSFNISPIKKLLKREIRQRFDKEKAEDGYLDSLFPGGVLDQGIKISGLPYPYLDEELRVRAPAKPHVVEVSEDTNDDQNSFVFEGHVVHLTPSGNVVEQHLWNESMANYLADKEDIDLTEDHWKVINFLRTFYEEYGIAPMVRLLEKHMMESGQKISKSRLYELFPKGPSRQGSRFAGLPDPQGCIDNL